MLDEKCFAVNSGRIGGFKLNLCVAGMMHDQLWNRLKALLIGLFFSDGISIVGSGKLNQKWKIITVTIYWPKQY